MRLTRNLNLRLCHPNKGPLINPNLRPLISMLPNTFRHNAFQIVLLSMLSGVLNILPMTLMNIRERGLLLVHTYNRNHPLTLPRNLRPRRLIVYLLVRIFVMHLVPTPRHCLRSFISLVWLGWFVWIVWTVWCVSVVCLVWIGTGTTTYLPVKPNV